MGVPGEIRTGCSGFNYRHWRERFYPAALPQRQWLAHYCTVFSTVELNVTFYRLLPPQTFDRWRDETPADFAFALKGSRYITHIKRLQEAGPATERFFEGALRLQNKLKVVLWQLPPGFTNARERLGTFLEGLERYPVRNAFEFRHESWLTKEVFDLCGKHRACLCMADWPEYLNDLPVTGDLVYMRRHGQGGQYNTRYTRSELEQDARRIRDWAAAGKDVFIYFNNDAHAYAPGNARELIALLR